MNKDQENLDQLIALLYDSQQAEQIADDIRQGDALLANCARPNLSADAARRLEHHVSRGLTAKKRRALLTRLSSTAAAMVIIAAVIGLSIRLNKHVEQHLAANDSSSGIYSKTLWDDSIQNSQDIAFTDMLSEIDSIAEGLTELDSNREHLFSEPSYDNVDTIEPSTDAADFWKG